jgi:hypothetical protein
MILIGVRGGFIMRLIAHSSLAITVFRLVQVLTDAVDTHSRGC